ncbi:MAG: AAA family ATPase, partial [Polyangiaceae bacterium]|nr:AAA family ATPase [Polyangiaceae bacterium]
MTERHRYFFGPFCFDSGTEELRRETQVVPLTPKASGVLGYLLEHGGELATKADLLSVVWRDTHVGEAVLKVAIREIRRALEDDANDPTYIVTVHRRGYRFVAELRRSVASERPRPRAQADASQAVALLPFGGVVPLVGREAELETLERLFAEAASGKPRVVFLRGDAGSGKTALARAFLERIGGAARTGEGACLMQRTATEPFFSLLSAIAALAGTGSPDATDRAVVEALLRHAPTWVMQLPALMARVDANELRSRVAGAGQARMLRELCETLSVLSASQPIVLVIEDAHFADAATLDVLEAVARDQHVGRTLLLVTYRPTTGDGVIASVDALKDALLARSTSRFLPLPPLDEAAVARFLVERFRGLEPTSELVSLAHRRTAGNPLFLAHVAADWEERGWVARDDQGSHRRTVPEDRMDEGLPDTLRHMLEGQLGALGEQEQQLLEAAAVAGESCSAALLGALTGIALDEAAVLAEKVSMGGPFLRPIGAEALPDGSVTERYGFSHGLYRDVCL